MRNVFKKVCFFLLKRKLKKDGVFVENIDGKNFLSIPQRNMKIEIFDMNMFVSDMKKFC